MKLKLAKKLVMNFLRFFFSYLEFKFKCFLMDRAFENNYGLCLVMGLLFFIHNNIALETFMIGFMLIFLINDLYHVRNVKYVKK